MTAIDKKPTTSPISTQSHLPLSQFPFSSDYSAFLNWDEARIDSDEELPVVFLSLVATVKLRPTLDNTLEEKAVTFLKYMEIIGDEPSAHAFLSSFARATDESLVNFLQCIVVLVSSASTAITTAAMKMLNKMIFCCSTELHLALVKADLIPQLINTINPQSLPFAEAEDINASLLNIVWNSLWLSTLECLEKLEIEDRHEQQAVHETVLKQVLAPSEKAIHAFYRHPGPTPRNMSFPSTDDGFSSSYAVFLTIPNCLTSFESDDSIWTFLNFMIGVRRDWNETRGEERQMWQKVQRMLRMEGMEDVMEEKMRNDRNEINGGFIVDNSIELNNLLGMNLPEPE
ncbi:hypothetical protein BLNAU_11759 [Blattamonas nauphoetae]|uniref:Uncharacterized protein n=1 Tax=Blattamonas nauphoetae TaxID=2049346 RepID=A0ABQ9XML7_9EUKA|nr:hypothetical protein BLNAU_11759 [Blattamonas nauphoetae]